MSNSSFGWLGSYVEPTHNPPSFPLLVTEAVNQFNLQWSGSPSHTLYFNIYGGLNEEEMSLIQTNISPTVFQAIVNVGVGYFDLYYFQVEAVLSPRKSVFSLVEQSIGAKFTFYSSQPYPVDLIDQMKSSSNFNSGFFITAPSDNISVNMGFTGGVLSGTEFPYLNWPAEQFKVVPAFTGGTLIIVNLTIEYTNWPAEQFKVVPAFTGGTIATIVVEYTNWPAEQFKVVPAFTGGTLV